MTPGPTRVPTLDAIVADPAALAGCPPAALLALRRQAAIALALLDEAVDRARLDGHAGTAGRPEAPPPDRLLTLAETAERLRTTRRWLLDHPKDIPGRRELSPRKIAYSERAIARYLAAR
jgi:hypothetical protein